MKFRQVQDDPWHHPSFKGKKHRIEITVDQSSSGWYFYGGGHNSLVSEIGAFPTKEEAFAAAEKWCDQQKKMKTE